MPSTAASTSRCRQAPGPAITGLPGARDRAGRRHRRARRRVDGDHRPAAPARRPRPAAAGRLTRRRAAPQTRVRAAEGAGKLPVPQQDSQRIGDRTGGPAAGGAVRADRRHRAGPRRAAAHRMVVDHRHRRPRRADAGRAGPVVVAGQRVGAGVHRRGPLPVRHRLLRGEGPRQGRPRRRGRHQSRAAGHRRDRRRRRAARTRAARRRRGARTRRPGDRRGHRRAVGHVAGRCAPPRRPAHRPRAGATARGRDRDASRRRSTTPHRAASTCSTTRWPPT